MNDLKNKTLVAMAAAMLTLGGLTLVGCEDEPEGLDLEAQQERMGIEAENTLEDMGDDAEHVGDEVKEGAEHLGDRMQRGAEEVEHEAEEHM